MSRTRFQRLATARLFASLLMLAFLAIESASFAHELRHDLQQHDDPACALHLYAEHLAKTAMSDAAVVLAIVEHMQLAAVQTPSLTLAPTSLYQVRAPPRAFLRSV